MSLVTESYGVKRVCSKSLINVCHKYESVDVKAIKGLASFIGDCTSFLIE